MSENVEYSAPKVDEWDLDPGGNYVSPAEEVDKVGAGVLSGTINP